MYEIMHRGLWVRWSGLDRRDRRAMSRGMLLFCLGGGLIGGAIGEAGAVGGGDRMTVLLACVAGLALLATGLALWMGFVRRQDEMFRQIQTAATLTGCFAAGAAGTAWGVLQLAMVVPPVQPLWFAGFGFVVFTLDWMRQARRRL